MLGISHNEGRVGADTITEVIVNMIKDVDTFTLEKSARTIWNIKSVKQKDVVKDILEDASGIKVKKVAKGI